MPYDILGEAITDYFEGNYSEDIITISSIAGEDVLPLPYLFRDYKTMPLIEQKALKICSGHVLDIGCGAGSHSLWLQNDGSTVTALDSSIGAIDICQKRGLSQTLNADIMKFSGAKYDTLLLLMNGVGLAGKLKKLSEFLNHLKGLLNPNGQIVLDSSNIIYMFDEDEDGGVWVPGEIDYYGEVTFQMSYKNRKGLPFNWLYVDYVTLEQFAFESGLKTTLLAEGDNYEYLAKLTPI